MAQRFTKDFKKWSAIVAKAWMDETFKEELLTNPNKVLRENGIDVPENIKFHVLEDQPDKKNLVLHDSATHFEYHDTQVKKLWQDFLALVNTDEQLKNRLFSQPAKVLKEHGIPVPRGVSLHMVADTDQNKYLVLPYKNDSLLSEADLRKVSGGQWDFSTDTSC